jgi:hypothetical protein
MREQVMILHGALLLLGDYERVAALPPLATFDSTNRVANVPYRLADRQLAPNSRHGPHGLCETRRGNLVSR